MNVLEMIARTTAHGVTYGQVGRSTLVASAQDVEWMMVGLPEFQEHLIRAAYQQDSGSRRKLKRHWVEHLLYLYSVSDTEDENDDDMIEKLAANSLDYWLSPRKCGDCKGTGVMLSDSKLSDCGICEGTGRHQQSPSRICKGLGLPRGHVYPKWVIRWNQALGKLDKEEGAAALHMLNRKR